MPVNEASEILALTLIFAVHVIGGLMLVLGMLDPGARPRWDQRGWWPRDDGPDGDPPAPEPPAPPPAARHQRPLPLPGAVASDVRLRDERRLRDARPRPPRRPQRGPQPERSPQRR